MTDDPRFAALLNLIERTGARSFTLEFHDDHDDAGLPTVWVAIAGVTDTGSGT